MNNEYSKFKLIVFFEKEEADLIVKQIQTLKKILDKPLSEIKEIVESGRAELTFFYKDYKDLTRELDEAEIFYQVFKTEEEKEEEEKETENIQNKEVKEHSQEINFIVSRDILKKKKNEIVECIIIPKEEYNELLKCKEITRDLIGSLRSLTADFSIALHNYIS